jgi:pilus assembly protein Flp/PilA
VYVRHLRTWLRRIAEEEAVTATEYAVMLALILLVCIATITQYGVNLGNKFTDVNATLFP